MSKVYTFFVDARDKVRARADVAPGGIAAWATKWGHEAPKYEIGSVVADARNTNSITVSTTRGCCYQRNAPGALVAAIKNARTKLQQQVASTTLIQEHLDAAMQDASTASTVSTANQVSQLEGDAVDNCNALDDLEAQMSETPTDKSENLLLIAQIADSTAL